MKVPWLSKDQIAGEANALISEHRSAKDAAVGPPMPVEMIAEQALGLQLSFDDLRTQLGVKDILELPVLALSGLRLPSASLTMKHG